MHRRGDYPDRNGFTLVVGIPGDRFSAGTDAAAVLGDAAGEGPRLGAGARLGDGPGDATPTAAGGLAARGGDAGTEDPTPDAFPVSDPARPVALDAESISNMRSICDRSTSSSPNTRAPCVSTARLISASSTSSVSTREDVRSETREDSASREDSALASDLALASRLRRRDAAGLHLAVADADADADRGGDLLRVCFATSARSPRGGDRRAANAAASPPPRAAAFARPRSAAAPRPRRVRRRARRRRRRRFAFATFRVAFALTHASRRRRRRVRGIFRGAVPSRRRR